LFGQEKDKKAKHIFNYDLMKNGTWPEDALKKPGLQMRSVWSIGTPKTIEKKFGKHPTQKPEDLLKRIVLASTNKGDLIVDPFTGSSTTGIAAYLLGRQFIGIDTDPKFLDLSIKRFEELDRNLKINLSNNYEDSNAGYGHKKFKKYIGQDLRKLAKDLGITTYETGKQNKGWKGLVLERLAGLQTNVSKAPNGLSYELKSVAFHYVKNELVPKRNNGNNNDKSRGIKSPFIF